MAQMLYADALVAALGEAMGGDPNVHLLGQYFLGLTEHRTKMVALREQFPDRFYFPPIAEIGYVGAAIGSAMVGLRPIVDLATASFMFQAFPQLLNEAANIHYMSAGATRVPMVFHFNHGIRGGGAAQHSHSPQAMLWNTPGLEIMVPSSPADVLGLVRTAVASDNPTAWVDHVRLFDTVGEVEDSGRAIPFGVADVKRVGTDVTIVASSYLVLRSLAAAAALAEEGISAEVVDLRTLVPLDEATIFESVSKTRHLVVVDECHRRCGVAAEIVATVAENIPDQLDAPVRRVTTADVPIPFSPPLEHFVEPSEAKIVDAVRACLR
jgi:pyruvate dehydrogenase E1 component beta subunit